MLKALLLIFDPDNTWEKIENARPKVLQVMFLYLIPLLLLSAAGEGGLLIKMGREEGPMEKVKPVAQELVLHYEVVQIALSLAVTFIGGWLLQKIGQGFHRRHKYSECFIAVAYSLGPLFLVRILAGLPALNTWICWAVGALLSVSALYRGVPRLMKPDPSNALGVYLLGSLLLLVLAGLAHFVAGLVLQQKILAKGWMF